MGDFLCKLHWNKYIVCCKRARLCILTISSHFKRKGLWRKCLHDFTNYIPFKKKTPPLGINTNTISLVIINRWSRAHLIVGILLISVEERTIMQREWSNVSCCQKHIFLICLYLGGEVWGFLLSFFLNNTKPIFKCTW